MGIAPTMTRTTMVKITMNTRRKTRKKFTSRSTRRSTSINSSGTMLPSNTGPTESNRTERRRLEAEAQLHVVHVRFICRCMFVIFCCLLPSLRVEDEKTNVIRRARRDTSLFLNTGFLVVCFLSSLLFEFLFSFFSVRARARACLLFLSGAVFPNVKTLH